MNDDEEQNGYTWEAGYADGLNIRDVLEEDEGGSVEKSIARLVAETRKKQRAVNKPAKIRLGIMRYVYLVVDCSRFMVDKSMPPSKLQVALGAAKTFLEKFFEQNPIAQVGVILCKDRKAERYIPLTGNIRQLKDMLSSVTELQCAGDFSLQNGLHLALTNLQDLPGHVSREVIVLVSALSSLDPGSVFTTIDALKAAHIRCSVVGMGAEVFVYKQLAKVTNGKYDVSCDGVHFGLLLATHTSPPPTSRAVECNAIRIGFPPHQDIEFPSFCQCHPESGPVSSRGFLCVQCGARHCSLPAECRLCRLILVSAPQLARAFRHLLPLPAFVPVQDEEKEKEQNGSGPPTSTEDSKEKDDETVTRECFACACELGKDQAYSCSECKSVFCFDCDLLIHESLNVCPSCS